MTTTTDDRPRRSTGTGLSSRNEPPLRSPSRPPGSRKAACGTCSVPQRSFSRRRTRREIGTVPGWKRGFDVAFVLATLPFSVPLILAVALWIRLVSRGPALFRQERVGHGEKVFTLFKFRTMHEGAPTGDHERHVARLVESDCPLVKLDQLGDPRLISGACFLRATGLDELPQLFNVLRGEMSLVGPRPCIPGEYGFFTAGQRERFRVLPGMTGLWQVNGKNRTTFREMAALDVAYARLSSFGLDLAVILRTPWALLREMGHCFQRRRQGARHESADDPLLGFGPRFGNRP